MLAAALLSLGAQASSRSWELVKLGDSRKALLLRLGPPRKLIRRSPADIYEYRGERALPEAKVARFQVSTDTNSVERIEIIPSAQLKLSAVTAKYGPACAAAAQTDCYQTKVTHEGTLYWYYPSRGMSVFVVPKRRVVARFVFTPVTTALDKSAAPKDSPDELSLDVSPLGKEFKAPVAAPTAPPAEPEEDKDSLPHPSMDSMFNEEATPGTTGEATGGFASVDSQTPEDPLKIGATLYTQLTAEASGTYAHPSFAPSAPALLDVYLDGRPNDRLRVMGVGRLEYNPISRTAGGPSSTTSAATSAATDSTGNGPTVQLDQLWLKFDLAKVLYVTLGRQHVKWGTSRFWSPTDFLVPLRVNPLAIYDDRVGSDLLKLNIPFPAAGANFYAFGVVVPPGGLEAASTLGAAVRAEVVLGPAELAAEAAVFQSGRPRFGAEFSAGLGPVDVRAEASYRSQPGLTVWQLREDADPEALYPDTFERSAAGRLLSFSGGVDLPIRVSEVSSLQLSVEGFYNPTGYTRVELLPWLMLQHEYRPFYAARYYAAAVATYSLSDFLSGSAVGLSVVGNLADRSYLARLDLAGHLVRDLSIELHASVPFGTRGGEFRFESQLPGPDLSTSGLTPLPEIAPPLFEAGLALRLAI